MDKSPDAFRTISEVAEVLETPAHVLRFWESRFPQIRPVKRAGGRRYYRPADVALLLGIKHLLHEEGMTIRGVQKVLREHGVRHVAGMSGQVVPDDAESAEAALEAALAANFGPPDDSSDLPQDQIESAQIVALEDALRARQPDTARTAFPIRESVVAVATPDPVAEAPSQVAQSGDGTAPEAAAFADHASADHAPDPVPEAPMLDLTADEDEINGDPGEGPAPDDVPPEATHEAPIEDSLLARLRALPPGCLATPDARALRARAAALADRMTSPPPSLPF